MSILEQIQIVDEKQTGKWWLKKTLSSSDSRASIAVSITSFMELSHDNPGF
ncbi:MAG: hypothetical protein AAF984_11360 [Verrucomicrobiota bacterium]